MYRCVQVTIYLQIYAYFIFNFTACISYPVCSMCKGLYNQLHLFFYIMCMSQNIGCLTASKSKKLNALMALSFHT